MVHLSLLLGQGVGVGVDGDLPSGIRGRFGREPSRAIARPRFAVRIKGYGFVGIGARRPILRRPARRLGRVASSRRRRSTGSKDCLDSNRRLDDLGHAGECHRLILGIPGGYGLGFDGPGARPAVPTTSHGNQRNREHTHDRRAASLRSPGLAVADTNHPMSLLDVVGDCNKPQRTHAPKGRGSPKSRKYLCA